MLIRRCTWHRLYRGYPKIMGFRAGQGLRPYFTDGLCRRCAQRVEQEWFGDPLPPSRLQTLLATPVSRRGIAAAAGVAALMFLVAPGDRVGVTAVSSSTPVLARAAAPVFMHVASAEASSEPVPPPIVTRAAGVVTRLSVPAVVPTPTPPPPSERPHVAAAVPDVPPVVWIEPPPAPPAAGVAPTPVVSHSGPRLESRGIEAP